MRRRREKVGSGIVWVSATAYKGLCNVHVKIINPKICRLLFIYTYEYINIYTHID